MPNFEIEKFYPNLKIIGIDEAGRGPLAGPVVAACAIIDKNFLQDKLCAQIDDSKKISARKRKEIFFQLQQKIKFSVGIIDEKIIDKINILQATKLAMLQAYQNFCKNYFFVDIILVDGNFAPFQLQDSLQKILPIVSGDSKSLSIACASIIAKETRDKIMLDLHQKYPQYGWNKNAGYPTKQHIDSIMKYGICEYHRTSFAPIKNYENNLRK